MNRKRRTDDLPLYTEGSICMDGRASSGAHRNPPLRTCFSLAPSAAVDADGDDAEDAAVAAAGVGDDAGVG